MKKILLFQVGNREFGIELPLIAAIHKVNSLAEERTETGKAVILTPDGEKLTVYDFSYILREPSESEIPGDRELMKIHSQGVPLGIKVDRVLRVIAGEDDKFEPIPPAFGKRTAECIPLVMKWDEKIIPIVDPDRIEKVLSWWMDQKNGLSKGDAVSEFQENDDVAIFEEPLEEGGELTENGFLEGLIDADDAQVADDDLDFSTDEIERLDEPDFFTPEKPPVPETEIMEPPEDGIPSAFFDDEKDELTKSEVQISGKNVKLEQFLEKYVAHGEMHDLIMGKVRGFIEKSVKDEIEKMKENNTLFPEIDPNTFLLKRT